MITYLNICCIAVSSVYVGLGMSLSGCERIVIVGMNAFAVLINVAAVCLFCGGASVMQTSINIVPLIWGMFCGSCEAISDHGRR